MDAWVEDLSKSFSRTAHNIEVRWEYETADGYWYEYEPDEHEKIEHLYQENVKTFEMKKMGSSVETLVVISLEDMTERDKTRGFVRKMRRRLKKIMASKGE